MSDARNSRLAPRSLGVIVLGACALWLVIQNTMLAVGLVWARSAEVAIVAAVLGKTAAALIQGFWSSPAAGWTLGVVAGVTLGALLPFVRREVLRHG